MQRYKTTRIICKKIPGSVMEILGNLATGVHAGPTHKADKAKHADNIHC
jgi:hypothetical protein